MKNAVSRFLLICLVTILVIAGVLLFLRQMGSGQAYAPLRHQLFENQPLVVVDASSESLEAPPQSMLAIEKIISNCSNCVVKLDVRLSRDQKPFVFSEHELGLYTHLSGYFSLKSSEQIQQTRYKNAPSSEKAKALKIIPLNELIETFPDTVFFLTVHSRDASTARIFLEGLKARSGAESLIIDSPFRQTLKEIREQEPRWLYATPPSYLMRVQIMNSLHIETVADIWPDVLVINPKQDSDTYVPAGVVKEYLRRKKLVLLPANSNEDLKSFSNSKALSGVLTESLEFAQKFTPSLNDTE